jgi:hypothetical protein
MIIIIRVNGACSPVADGDSARDLEYAVASFQYVGVAAGGQHREAARRVDPQTDEVRRYPHPVAVDSVDVRVQNEVEDVGAGILLDEGAQLLGSSKSRPAQAAASQVSIAWQYDASSCWTSGRSPAASVDTDQPP